jgi:phytoene synthase
MRLLPAERRDAMFAVYAFCRTVDDVADGAASREAKLSELAAWRAEVAALYRGKPGRSATLALAGPVARYGLRAEDFLAVIAGMEMDAAGRMVAPGLGELGLYCGRAASAVGRLAAPVFGLPAAAGRALARPLGRALQLTNVLRDLREDAARGRLYLPGEILARSGIAAREPAEVLAHPRIPRACAEVAAMAERRFAAARALLAQCPRGPARPALMMCRVYETLLARLERRGFTPERIDTPVRLGPAEKALIALGASLGWTPQTM